MRQKAYAIKLLAAEATAGNASVTVLNTRLDMVTGKPANPPKPALDGKIMKEI